MLKALQRIEVFISLDAYTNHDRIGKNLVAKIDDYSCVRIYWPVKVAGAHLHISLRVPPSGLQLMVSVYIYTVDTYDIMITNRNATRH